MILATPPAAPIRSGAPKGLGLAKTLYAALFCLVIPAALAAWAVALSPLVPWPAWHSLWLGAGLLLTGVTLMLAAFDSLRRFGRGLPMNAFPPPVFVSQGPYRWMRDPIYVGFCLAVAGATLATASRGGMWVVTPLVILGCTALVWGYERQDLDRRFGAEVARHRPLLHFPSDGLSPPGLSDRVSVYVLVLLPWLILYYLTAGLPTPPDAISGWMHFEYGLPVLEWTEIIYASAYVMVIVTPLLATTGRDLRLFASAGAVSMAIVFPFYLVVPVVSPPRDFTAAGFLGQMLQWERLCDGHGSNACPAYHVLWACIAAVCLAGRGGGWRWAAPTWALLIAASCLTTGQHSLLDVGAAFLVLPLVLFLPVIYRRVVAFTQWLGNSFHARNFGPVRVINHALFSGLAAATGTLAICVLIGPQHLPAAVMVGFFSVIGAALWAQVIEGSPKLLRPFGYYGSIVGAFFAALAAPLLGSSTDLILAALATAAPIIQAIGRLRCIVQGCCHGKPLSPRADPRMGLCITNPSSRICAMAGFRGVAIHPAPLYSILGNLAIAICLGRLWTLHAAPGILIGMYMILAGMARFVEEAYRGEPQTRHWAGLAEYQWYAVASVIGGAIATIWPTGGGVPAIDFEAALRPAPLAAAAAMGLFTAAAMSVDFPRSVRRFARLTG
jgi:protein-S-isoprenylcysteine O-methyltransferase Ste14